MHKLLSISLIFTVSLTAKIFASAKLDAEYGNRNIAAIVTNVDKEPVYGEKVENEIVGFLRTNQRFEFSDPGYLYLKDKFRPASRRTDSLALPGVDLDPFRPLISD